MKALKGAAALGLGCVLSSTAMARDLVLTANGQTVEVAAITSSVVRVRIHPDGFTPADESWVVDMSTREKRADAVIGADNLSTANLHVTVDPRTLAIRIIDAKGKPIVEDSARPFEINTRGFTLNKNFGIGEHVFGLGDKTGSLDRRGHSFVNWNTDSYGFQASDDPIYKSIPFYVSTGGSGGAYGLFLDNSRRSWFDFGHRAADTLSFGAEGGTIDYYVIVGPTVPDVVHRYTALTGRAPLPPRWVLGYQQSRWSYMSEEEVRGIAARLRKDRVPTDVIWLDIDFQDRNRPFTINPDTFPTFRQMVRDLAADGIKAVAITDLHIARAPGETYAPYDSGIAADHFLHNPDGSTYVGSVWPGPSVFPDFTRKATRDWWGGLFRGLVDDGVAGIWNDMNEPAIFESPTKTMPLTVRHRIEDTGFATRTTDHAEIHNIYGMENSRATYDGLRRLRPDERAFVMTRASFAGGQRYAATWTGDNSSTWDHLKLSVAQTLNLGLSGFNWTGADVGGFTGGPSPELLTRWFQFATFAPIFRDHSQKDVPRAEPWVHGPEQLDIRRRYVEERYRLMPFLYTLAETNARTGDPMMRPIFYDFPAALGSDCDMAMQFTLGGKLLVAGSPKPESPARYKACLPAGGWYDYWTGARVDPIATAGSAIETLDIVPRLDMLPVFVRAGAALPRQPLVQSTSEHPDGPLEIHIYPGDGCSGEIYDDDGHSMGFTRGDYLRQSISCSADRKGLTAVSLGPREGQFAPWWKDIRIVIHGSRRYRAASNGRELPVEQSDFASAFTLADARSGATVRLAVQD